MNRDERYVSERCFASSANGQVFDPGPSDPALFDNVINLPADMPSFSGTLGDGPTEQLNVSDGGSVTDLAKIRVGGEINMTDGSIGDDVFTLTGSEVNISGGSVGTFFEQVGFTINFPWEVRIDQMIWTQ